jgi:hypothetical protein
VPKALGVSNNCASDDDFSTFSWNILYRYFSFNFIFSIWISLILYKAQNLLFQIESISFPWITERERMSRLTLTGHTTLWGTSSHVPFRKTTSHQAHRKDLGSFQTSTSQGKIPQKKAWKNYVDEIKCDTPLKQEWWKIRAISGKNDQKMIRTLKKSDGNLTTNRKEIAQ